jgi:hypothetical protein
MQRVSDAELMRQFLGWQCRIRQAAHRNHGGAPPPGARPRVIRRSGEELLATMTVVLVPKTPRESTAFLKFQAGRNNDPKDVYQAGLKYFAGEFYQEPELFSDEMTALFAPESETAEAIAGARSCLLKFEQHSQRYTLSCRIRKLAVGEPDYEATWWHNRIFNPGVPNNAAVLGFKPDWKSASADPWPQEVTSSGRRR